MTGGVVTMYYVPNSPIILQVIIHLLPELRSSVHMLAGRERFSI